LILIEMIARVIKHQIRERLRNQTKLWHLPLEHSCRKEVISFLNLIFGTHEESERYFNTTIYQKLFSNFNAFPVTEPQPSAYPDGNLKALCKDNLCLLFRLVQQMTSLCFSENALKEFSTDPSVFKFKKPFHPTELEEIGVHTRHINIVALAQGYILKHTARSKSNSAHSSRLCKLALEKFQQALEDNPNDKRVLCELADTCTILHDVKNADLYYKRAIDIDPSDANSLFKYAVFLEEKMENKESEAEEYYLRTLETNPVHDHCLQRYGHFLESRGTPDEAEAFFIRASEIRSLRKAPEAQSASIFS